MATVTRQRLNPTVVTATTIAGGTLPVGQYWFNIMPLNTAGSYLETGLASGGSSNIATATTTAGNQAIRLDWTAVPGAVGYLIYWTQVNPGTNPENMNLNGWLIKTPAGVYNASVGNVTTFTFDSNRTTGSPYHSNAWNAFANYTRICNEPVDSLRIVASSATVTFNQLVDICVANGWDSIQRLNQNSFFVRSTIRVDSAPTTLDFRNINVITLGGIYNNGTGNVTMLGTNTTGGGGQDTCSWINVFGQGVCTRIYHSFRDLRWFNLNFIGHRPFFRDLAAPMMQMPVLGADFQVYNLSLDGCQQFQFVAAAIAGSFIRESKIYNGRWAWRFEANMALADISNIVSFSSGADVYLARVSAFRGLSVTDNRGAFHIIAVRPDVNNPAQCDIRDSLIDLSRDTTRGLSPFAVRWFNSGIVHTGTEFINEWKTQRFRVKRSDNTPVVGANIRVSNRHGTEVANLTTNAQGTAQAEFLIGVNQSLLQAADNNGRYTTNNPYTVRITASGFRDYTDVTNILDHRDEKEIVLTPKARIMYIKV